MARKQKHEDHLNHEAWAIPYGDLMTLLLAFFVVMYAVSSVNEGRYRVLADSLSQAFGGPPKSMQPVQIGDKPVKGAQSDALFNTPSMRGFEKEASKISPDIKRAAMGNRPSPSEAEQRRQMAQMAAQVEAAMKDLIRQRLILVRRSEFGLEIEIRTDILFASGSAQVATDAVPVLHRLAQILAPFEQMLRIEGHTDNVPIATSIYPSNWELSAARAASVVHVLAQSGVPPERMSVAGYGEYRPATENANSEGRNRNRRVVIVAGALNGQAESEPVSAAGADTEVSVVTEQVAP